MPVAFLQEKRWLWRLSCCEFQTAQTRLVALNSGTECPCPAKNSVNWEAAEEYIRTDAIALGFRLPLQAPVRIGSGLAGEIGHNANRVPLLMGTSIDLGAAGRHDGRR